MDVATFEESLGPELILALRKKGYETLTSVQSAVLDPKLADADLRVLSQTGSGKTVAIGFLLRKVVMDDHASESRAGRPRALVLTPTRELARQVESELRWLYGALGIKVASVTGGASYRDELRALADGPAVVVATPGRLADHLDRKSVRTDNVAAVVLDEADRMLDMGFRDDIEAILGKVSGEHRTHMVSATFGNDVAALANRVQNAPVWVYGTERGLANQDISHVVHLVSPEQRYDALVNLLLLRPDEKVLVFCRTRADVAELSSSLSEDGFGVAALSGDMEQRERNSALRGFREGRLKVLVATDVAARGLDVQDISTVVQMDPPTDAETYTHRSGRTGRAGQKGMSILFVAPRGYLRTAELLRRAKVTFAAEPIPTAADVQARIDESLATQLEAPDENWSETDPSLEALASRLAESTNVKLVLTRLLSKAGLRGTTAARHVKVYMPESDRKPLRAPKARTSSTALRGRGEEIPRYGKAERPASPRFARDEAPRFPRDEAAPRPRFARDQVGDRPRPEIERPRYVRDESSERPARRPHDDVAWTSFHISWGSKHGADPRRLLAMVCRRGEIDKSNVGAIRIGPFTSEVEIATTAAKDFEVQAGRPDPRDARVRILPASVRGSVKNTRPKAVTRTMEPIRRERPSRSRLSD
jgi:ATP-dependent RNA helicase DeaD